MFANRVSAKPIPLVDDFESGFKYIYVFHKKRTGTDSTNRFCRYENDIRLT